MLVIKLVILGNISSYVVMFSIFDHKICVENFGQICNAEFQNEGVRVFFLDIHPFWAERVSQREGVGN